MSTKGYLTATDKTALQNAIATAKSEAISTAGTNADNKFVTPAAMDSALSTKGYLTATDKTDLQSAIATAKSEAISTAATNAASTYATKTSVDTIRTSFNDLVLVLDETLSAEPTLSDPITYEGSGSSSGSGSGSSGGHTFNDLLIYEERDLELEP